MAPKKKKHKKPSHRLTFLPSWVGYLFLLLGLAAHLVLLVQYDFTQDDAYITFRYAANFINGDGLVYNAGERVEGYTNFLWTILMIIGGLAGVDYVVYSKVLGGAFGLGTIILLFFAARSVFADLTRTRQIVLSGLSAFILGTVYSFAYWTVAGLETAAFTFLTVLSLYLYTRRSFLAIPSLVAASLVRPEGALVFVFILVYEIVSRRQVTGYAGALAILYIVFLIPFVVFKLSYYNSLLPNPFYAKTTFTLQQVRYGLEYTGQFFWHYLGAGVFLLPALFRFRRLPPGLKTMVVFLLVYTLYITVIGGDVLKVHRFFVPLFPLFILAMVYGMYELFRRKSVFILGLVILLAWQMYFPRDHVRTFNFREVGFAWKMDNFATHLLASDESNFSLAVSTIGIIGYRLLGHTIIDMLGLTDSTIARHPEPYIEGLETTWREQHFNSRYLLSRQPDYILFSTGSKPSAPAERALFLYSSFLRSYRTIGFFYGSLMHPAYKRYYPIEGDIVRDVDVNFVQEFNNGLNMLRSTDQRYVEAMAALDRALKYCPEEYYPYLYYFMSDARRKLGDLEASYEYLKQAAALDTLVYEVYKDLYLFEYLLKNYDAAREYRERTARLVPWYMPRLDSLVLGKNP